VSALETIAISWSHPFNRCCKLTFHMTGREYADLLREAATFFESHPDLPVPEAYRSLAVLYEKPDENAAKVLEIVKKEGFSPQGNATGGLVMWERQCGRGTLCFIVPSGEASKAN